MKLDEGFLWGASTADFQYEGGLAEKSRGLLAADYVTSGTNDAMRRITCLRKDGTFQSVGVYDSLPEDSVPAIDPKEYYPSHKAVDFYNHWEEDIEAFHSLGLKAYRFSICWTRIFPNGNDCEANEEGLMFYEKMIDKLIASKIEPVVTICHDEIPAKLANDYEGWKSRETIECYMRLCKTLYSRFSKRVKYWIAFNEINAVTGYSQLGIHDISQQSRYQAVHHCLVAASLAVKLGHEMIPDSKIGIMFSSSALYPATCKPEDVFKTMQTRRENLYYYIDTMTRGGYPAYAEKIWKDYDVKLDICDQDKDFLKNYPIDYVAISYYRSMTEGIGVKRNTSNLVLDAGGNPYLEKTQWGYPIDPLGLRYVLNELYDRYGKAIMIVENGLGAIDKLEGNQIHDSYRIDFISKHIKEMMNAVIIDNIPVIGYFVWSPVDLISLSTGEMKKRYGMFYVDMDDDGKGSCRRWPKDSVKWYRQVIDTNGAYIENGDG